MRCYTEQAAQRNLSDLLDQADRGPVFIEREHGKATVLLSETEYARLHKIAVEEFNAVCADVSAKAAANGLTEEILADILRNE